MKSIDEVYRELIELPGVPIPRQLGNSQVFEFRSQARPAFLLAMRDAGRIPDYSSPDRLWIEGLDPVLIRYVELLKGGDDFALLPPAVCLVLDNPGNALVAVQLRDLAAQHRRRLREHPTDARFTFMLRRTKTAYIVEGAYGSPDIPVKALGSLKALGAAIVSAVARKPAT